MGENKTFQNYLELEHTTVYSFIDRLKRLNISEIPESIKKCTCCERHRTRLPYEHPKTLNMWNKCSYCDCPCRYAARIINRNYMDFKLPFEGQVHDGNIFNEQNYARCQYSQWG